MNRTNIMHNDMPTQIDMYVYIYIFIHDYTYMNGVFDPEKLDEPKPSPRWASYLLTSVILLTAVGLLRDPGDGT